MHERSSVPILSTIRHTEKYFHKKKSHTPPLWAFLEYQFSIQYSFSKVCFMNLVNGEQLVFMIFFFNYLYLPEKKKIPKQWILFQIIFKLKQHWMYQGNFCFRDAFQKHIFLLGCFMCVTTSQLLKFISSPTH